MNWGFCGFGHIAKKFYTALMGTEGQNVVAIATRSKMDEAKEWASNCTYYDSYESMAQDPNIDIVYINTTHNFHVQQVAIFAASGKHVVCEKPMYIHPDEIALLHPFYDKVFIMEALWTRFLPAYRFVKNVIDQNRLGKIKWLDVDFAFDNSQDPKQRLQTLALAGGALLDIGVYNIQLALDMMNNKMPDAIKATGSLNTHKVDLTTAILMRWNEEDVYANTFCSVDRIGGNKATIYGENGYISMKNFWMCEEVSLKYNDQDEEVHQFPHRINGFEYQIDEVIKCIKDNKTQSDIMSLEHSAKIAHIMGNVKDQIGYGL